MKFGRYCVLESLASERSAVRRAMKTIDSQIVEADAPAAGCLVVGGDGDVDEFFDSEFCFMTFACVKEVMEQGLGGFPVTERNKQLVSLALADLRIGLVGLSTDVIYECAQKVALLNGQIVPLSESVDVVIAERGFAAGVFRARERRVPVVRREWLERTYGERVFQEYEKHLLPVFERWTFTSTDLTPSDANELKRIVLAGGGNWQSTYDGDVLCVIANNLLPTKKIWLALEAGVPIVKPALIRDFGSGVFHPFHSYLLNWWGEASDAPRLFEKMTFSVDSEAPWSEPLKRLIEENGGKVEKPCMFRVLSHGHEKASKPGAVSVHWVLSCLENRKIVKLEDCLIYRPVRFSVPIRDMENVTVSLFRLSDQARPVIAEIIRIMGGTVYYRLHKQSTYVIAEEEDEEMQKRAAEMNIPVLCPYFIIHIAKTGKLPDPNGFLLQGPDNTKLMQFAEALEQKTRDVQEEEKRPLTKSDLEQFTQEYLELSQIRPTEISYEPESQKQIRESQDLRYFFGEMTQGES